MGAPRRPSVPRTLLASTGRPAAVPGPTAGWQQRSRAEAWGGRRWAERAAQRGMARREPGEEGERKRGLRASGEASRPAGRWAAERERLAVPWRSGFGEEGSRGLQGRAGAGPFLPGFSSPRGAFNTHGRVRPRLQTRSCAPEAEPQPSAPTTRSGGCAHAPPADPVLSGWPLSPRPPRVPWAGLTCICADLQGLHDSPVGCAYEGISLLQGFQILGRHTKVSCKMKISDKAFEGHSSTPGPGVIKVCYEDSGLCISNWLTVVIFF